MQKIKYTTEFPFMVESDDGEFYYVVEVDALLKKLISCETRRFRDGGVCGITDAGEVSPSFSCDKHQFWTFETIEDSIRKAFGKGK